LEERAARTSDLSRRFQQTFNKYHTLFFFFNSARDKERAEKRLSLAAPFLGSFSAKSRAAKRSPQVAMARKGWCKARADEISASILERGWYDQSVAPHRVRKFGLGFGFASFLLEFMRSAASGKVYRVGSV
jgi:hypothetical protein